MNIINLGSRVVNTWLVEMEEGYLLIDTGYPEGYQSFIQKLKQKGIGPQDIRLIFLTHAHDDHAGFLNRLLHETDAPVMLHPEAVKGLQRGQNSFGGGCTTRLAWFSCQIMKLLGKAEHRFPPLGAQFERRCLLLDAAGRANAEKRIGARILCTPGHTACSVSLLFPDGSLFCGDAAMNGIPSRHRVTIWAEDLKAFGRSWQEMLLQNPVQIYPGHGRPFPPSDLERFLPKLRRHRLYPI